MLTKLLEKLRRIDNSTHNHNHYNSNDKSAELIIEAQERYAECTAGEIIVVDFGLLQDPPRFGNMREVYVVETTSNDVKIRLGVMGESKTPNEKWVPEWVVTSNLGPAKEYLNKEQLAKYGITLPDPLPLVTGTFIEEIDDNYYIVEIDKVNGVYLIHFTSDSQAVVIEPGHDRILHNFSQPGKEGNYILEPGLYIDEKHKLVEVVPFKGSCWYRLIDETDIVKLSPQTALTFNRIETDDDGLEYYLLGVDTDNTPEETPEDEKPSDLKDHQPEKCCENPGECNNPTDPI